MGVNQRHLIKMSDREVEEFLHGRHTLSMATIGPDGSVHLVAMWYGFLEGAVAVETKAKSQKVQNLRRDPRITVMVDFGDSYEELKGVEMVGKAEIIDDPERMWELGVSVFERYQGPYSEKMRPFVEAMLHKRVVIKVIPDRVVTWDHSKLGATMPTSTMPTSTGPTSTMPASTGPTSTMPASTGPASTGPAGGCGNEG